MPTRATDGAKSRPPQPGTVHHPLVSDTAGRSRPAEDEVVPWHRYYGAISGVGIAIVALSLGLGLSSGFVIGLLGLVVATFAFCSACHWVTEARDDD